MRHTRFVPPILLAMVATTAAADPPLLLNVAPEPQRLEDIVITAQPDPMAEAYLSLRRITSELPCLGCAALTAAASGLMLAQYVGANVMPPMDTLARTAFEVRCMNPWPDVEYRC